MRFHKKHIRDVIDQFDNDPDYFRVGLGSFSIVYGQYNTGLVTKVIDCDLDPVIEYIEITRKYDSIHFPKYRNCKQYIDGYSVQLEKLDPISNIQAKIIPVAKSFVELGCVFPSDEHYLKSNRYFFKALQFLKDNIPEDCMWDIKSDNIMSRQGKLVITDPWYRTETLDEQNYNYR